jgi:YVTN family beta-propeller protein
MILSNLRCRATRYLVGCLMQTAGKWRQSVFILALVCLLSQGGPNSCVAATYGYVTNNWDNNVTVIDIGKNTAIGTPIGVGQRPYGVAISPDGASVYVTNVVSETVSVIDAASRKVVSTIPVPDPVGIAVDPSGKQAYVASGNNLAVIDTNTNSVIATVSYPGHTATHAGEQDIPGMTSLGGVAVNPNGGHVYAASEAAGVWSIDTKTNTVDAWADSGPCEGIAVNSTGTFAYVAGNNIGFAVDLTPVPPSYSGELSTLSTVSITPNNGYQGNAVAINPTGTRAYISQEKFNMVTVVDTSSNTVIKKIPVNAPFGISVEPAGASVYVVNNDQDSDSVTAIDAASNTVVGTVPVGWHPVAFGQFIGPSPAGTVNAVCGSSNGGTFASAPTTNLCSAGTPTTVTGNGPWNWTCQGENGGTNASCSAKVQSAAGNGVCGSANGRNFLKAPSSSLLCSAGKASKVAGKGPWSWTCAGSHGGSTASCSANLEVNGVCGSSNGKAYTAVPLSNLCKAGTASSILGFGPWDWTCQGANGGTNASCSAKLKVNGVCGAANKKKFFTQPDSDLLCSAGSASSVTGKGPWKWKCAGSNGGKSASCSANLEANGVCGSANGRSFTKVPSASLLCSVGKASKVTGKGPWSWSCAGSNGGLAASCSADIQ